jgi:hypothetical protein
MNSQNISGTKMESKILKTLLVLIILIAILTVCANNFSKMSSTWGQAGLVAAMLIALYLGYKSIKIIFKK